MSADYANPAELEALVADRLVSRRKHQSLPLWIYNYTARAQSLGSSQWPMALQDARGLILDDKGAIVGRPFRKFWNYEQVLEKIPSEEPFTVWEKVDGSLGIVCSYQGQRVVATRGAFESDQSLWAKKWLDEHSPAFLPREGKTYLYEIVYPDNRIVVDYGTRTALVLLSVLNADATDDDDSFDIADFEKAARFDGLSDFSEINSLPCLDGQEGLVIRWQSGFRAKLKLDEYKRLHRLITQCSTRTIWELLRSGHSTESLFERVPADFKDWASSQVSNLMKSHAALMAAAQRDFAEAPTCATRKDFAEYAKGRPNTNLLFSLLDGKPIGDAAWKLVEPQWATPFRQEADE